MSFKTLLQTEKHILSQGSVYELLRRSPEVVFDENILFSSLIYDEAYAEVLDRVFRSYIDTAVASGFSISVSTATWRANEERIRASRFASHAVRARIQFHVLPEFLVVCSTIFGFVPMGNTYDALNVGADIDSCHFSFS
jgi:hypothetical protein